MSPLSYPYVPEIILNKVVLPVPLIPIIPILSPSFTVKDTSCSIESIPKLLFKLLHDRTIINFIPP